ncbi:class I SAM-dependent methyltransferase [Dictyobacter formicarum]|uniref:Methyltransferase n=1 Tax=Dictyobacter formicarum TaxID=2778368 RepID=A0ABQ3VPB1_9CHLR|nr:SAM-dependent methyltransferase [Dictyobacter formicarum]GHO87645.1 methyltransferase [Dictyobacter formicarum]
MRTRKKTEELQEKTTAQEGDTFNYQQLIKNTLLHNDQFLKATLSLPANKQDGNWTKVVIRPVMIRGKKHLQFSYFDAQRDITKNYAGEEQLQQIDVLLSLEFKYIHLYTQAQTTQIHITKKNKVQIHSTKATGEHQKGDLSHDRQKKTFLAEPAAVPFLQAVGIVGNHGKINVDMYSKYRQIQEFIKLVFQTGALEHLPASLLHVVDAGCGNAYLTFAFYYYLHEYLQRSTEMIGIDSRSEPLEKHQEKVVQLGWTDLQFETSTIIDFHPRVAPHIVLSLHACDTATDEALAQGIQWGSSLLVSVPCCHHHLQVQLEQQPAPAPFSSVLRHSILKERLGDILTDDFRVLILQIMGYQADIVQFVSNEHTAKNLMIRARKSHRPGNLRAVHEYKNLKAFWNVTPYLEQLLAEHITRYLD